MAGTKTNAASKPITAAELLEQGFSPVEIRDLKTLRDNWNPASEQAASTLEWRRMQFAKWLYDNGRYDEQSAA